MHGRVKTEMQWYGTADAAPEKNKWVVSSSKTLQASHLHLDSGSLHKCIETFMLPPRTVDCWIYMSEFLFTDVFRISCIWCCWAWIVPYMVQVWVVEVRCSTIWCRQQIIHDRCWSSRRNTLQITIDLACSPAGIPKDSYLLLQMHTPHGTNRSIGVTPQTLATPIIKKLIDHLENLPVSGVKSNTWRELLLTTLAEHRVPCLDHDPPWTVRLVCIVYVLSQYSSTV